MRQRLHRQRHAAAVFILDDEVSCVGRYDVELARQLSHFIPQLGVLAVQPDFVQQITDPARRPQARDEFMFLGGAWKIDLVSELARHAVHRAFENDGGTSLP